MQCRILSSSLVDNIEHTVFELDDDDEAGMNEVVEETVAKLDEFEELFGDKLFGLDVDFLDLVGSPSANTQDRFIPAFSQAWKRQY